MLYLLMDHTHRDCIVMNCEKQAVLMEKLTDPEAEYAYCADHASNIVAHCDCGARLLTQFDLITGECPTCFNADR